MAQAQIAGLGNLAQWRGHRLLQRLGGHAERAAEDGQTGCVGLGAHQQANVALRTTLGQRLVEVGHADEVDVRDAAAGQGVQEQAHRAHPLTLHGFAAR